MKRQRKCANDVTKKRAIFVYVLQHPPHVENGGQLSRLKRHEARNKMYQQSARGTRRTVLLFMTGNSAKKKTYPLHVL